MDYLYRLITKEHGDTREVLLWIMYFLAQMSTEIILDFIMENTISPVLLEMFFFPF